MNLNPQNRWFMEDGTEVTANGIDSIYINGRNTRPDGKVPMEQVFIEHGKGGMEELHFICASADYPIELELDSHRFHLFELDGFRVKETVARRLFLQPGETARVRIEKIQDLEIQEYSRTSFLLKATITGKYRGWTNKQKRKIIKDIEDLL